LIIGHWRCADFQLPGLLALSALFTAALFAQTPKASENLETAFQRAMAIRPKVGGFPYLAETLRLAGT